MTQQSRRVHQLFSTVAESWRRAVLAMGMIGVAMIASTAPVGAAPQAALDHFYTVPKLNEEAPHGSVLRTRELTSSSLITREVRAVQLLYTSRGADPGLQPTIDGAPTGVSGTVLVPRDPWQGEGSRPVVGLAPGTHGQGQNCSASKQIAENTEIQLGDALPLLARGFAVAISDYEGYTNGGTHPYTVGQVLGRNVLDVIRATRAIPGSGVDEQSPVALWGYSEGGAGASWAAELAATYTPELNIAAVAAGGTPTYLSDTARFLDGGLYVDFALNAAAGLDAAYPSIDLAERHLNAAGREARRVNQQPDRCLAQTVSGHPYARSSMFTRTGQSLTDLLALPEVAAVVDAQTLGRIRYDAPTFLYWGDEDDIVPAFTQRKQFDMYCGLGMRVERHSSPGLNHILTQQSMIPQVTAWIDHTILTGASTNNC